MRKAQKMGAAGLALALALTVAACGGQQAGPAKASTDSKAPAAADQASKPAAPAQPSGKFEPKPLKVTLAGYSAGGASAAVGQAIGGAISKLAPGSVFTYEPGQGGANEIKVSKGENDFGLSSSVLVRAANEGTAPYDQKFTNLRAIAFLHTSDVQFIVDKRSGINSLDDLRTKPIKLATNTKNSFMELTMRAALAAMGTPFDAIEKRGGKVFYTNTNTALDQMRNRQVDVIGMATLTPTTNFTDAANTLDLAVLGLTDDAIQKVNSSFGTRSVTIPKSAYPFQKEDVKSVGIDNILITRAEVPDDVAYQVAKSLYENMEYMYGVSVTLKQMTKENMTNVGQGVQLHPGALKFYKEVGLIK